jgi:hypothetical protein
VCDNNQLEEDKSLWHLQEMLPQISNEKIREGIFNGPDIKKLTNGRNVEVLQGT